MGIEVPFKATSALLLFIITIVSAYYSGQPDTAQPDVLRFFSYASGTFFLARGPITWTEYAIYRIPYEKTRDGDWKVLAQVDGLVFIPWMSEIAQVVAYILGIWFVILSLFLLA